MAEFFQQFISSLLAFFMAIAAFFGVSFDKEKTVKNVIYFIGDGMGAYHLDMTEKDRGVKLNIKSLPQQGLAMTHSASDGTTDSAAGATALACGVKTYNGAVGYYWFDEPNCPYPVGSVPKNLTELCKENNMKTGIVTTDHLSGATPGGFSAHVSSRGYGDEINEQQLGSGIDLLWGKDDEYITEEKAAAAGYTYIDTIEEMNALKGTEKSIGQFTDSTYHTYNKNDYTPTLSQMADKAINLLNTKNKNGFFLMIEGAHIDKKSHSNDRENATDAALEFDNAVKKAVDFAKEDGHTLVVITADHETGGIIINSEGDYEYTTGGHTPANVPIAAYGPVTFINNGEVIENNEIPKRIASALEFKEESFPCILEVEENTAKKAA